MSDIMTVSEVAEHLKVSTTKVHGLIYSGELRAFRLGEKGRWRVSRDDLEAFIEFRKSLQRDPREPARPETVGPFGLTARSAAIWANRRERHFGG